jgi:hypothetical protein
MDGALWSTDGAAMEHLEQSKFNANASAPALAFALNLLCRTAVDVMLLLL